MLNYKSIKTQLIFYLIFFVLYLAVKDRNILFLTATIIAVISSAAVESVWLYFKTKTFQVTESSVITGLILGFVLSSDEAWWKFIAASFLSILSKYLIRFRKKHIFNPAAFGIFLTLVIFGASTQWNGTYLWYILFPFGIYFAYKMKKTEIIIGYIVVFLILSGSQAAIEKLSFLHIFGYLSYFYIFVMIIEPKTTPMGSIGKFIFGAGVSGFIFVLTMLGARLDIELFSLLVMNAAVPLLNKLAIKKEA